MNWNLFSVVVLFVVTGLCAVRRALKASARAPDRERSPVASARTPGERAWREQPVQTFVWQLQAARYRQPPFRRP